MDRVVSLNEVIVLTNISKIESLIYTMDFEIFNDSIWLFF